MSNSTTHQNIEKLTAFPELIMPTILVQLLVKGKSIGLFRALCDTGAQINLIQSNSIKYSLDSAESFRATLFDIDDECVQVKRKITVSIRPWYDCGNQSLELNVSLVVLPKSSQFAAVFPKENISRNAIQRPLNGPIADPFFWKTSNVPILLGIEFWSLIAEGFSYKIAQNLTCQDPLVGNVIYGQVNDSACNELASCAKC